MGLLDYVCLGAMVLHIGICPFTKVEESFNLQAMHDILYHGSELKQYDHLEFPGVVPRTFLGPLFVSLLSAPAVKITQLLGHSKLISQYIVRLTLGLWIFYSFGKFKQVISGSLGPSVGRWLMIITATQFHFMFYMSRPLPNIFALGMVLQSYHWWMRNKHARFIWTAAFAIIVFRAELCLLYGLIALMDLIRGRLPFLKLLMHAVPAGLVSLGLTVYVDSVFWERSLWPEGEVFWYNTIQNKSSNWGTSPFLWYFYSAIPRALSASLLLVPVGAFLEKKAVYLLLPALGFVLLFSFLPHKELRFIIYVFPILNAVAATACARMWQGIQRQSLWRKFVALIAVGHLGVNIATTCGFLYVSYHNYPGGDAIMRLQEMEQHYIGARVHIDVATAQTGVSRFTQLHDNWQYSKTEDLEPGSKEMMSYTHILVGVSSDLAEIQPYNDTHKLLDTVYSFSGISFQRDDNLISLDISMPPKICILKNKSMPRWPPTHSAQVN